jgi:hypothetical protein
MEMCDDKVGEDDVEASDGPLVRLPKPPIFKLGEKVSKSVRIFLMNRGWVEHGSVRAGDRMWNLYWQDRPYQQEMHDNCLDNQRINHFQHTSAITRKDELAINMSALQAKYGSVF